MTTPVRMLINQLLEFDHFGSRQAASLHADEISPDHPGRLPDKKQQVPQKMKLTNPSSGLRLSAKFVHDGYQIFVTLGGTPALRDSWRDCATRSLEYISPTPLA